MRRKPGLRSKISQTKDDNCVGTVDSGADLCVHTPATEGYLSPENLNFSKALTRVAEAKQLVAIGITDFHTTAGYQPVREAAEGTRVTVLPGFNLRIKAANCNNLILSCVFPGEITETNLTGILRALGVRAEHAGDPKLCVPASPNEVVAAAVEYGGLLVALRADKNPSRLAAIPALIQAGVQYFDLLYNETREGVLSGMNFATVAFSGAFSLSQVGSRMVGWDERPFNLAKFIKALSAPLVRETKSEGSRKASLKI